MYVQIDLLNREFPKPIIIVTDNPLDAQCAGWTLLLDRGRPVNKIIPETRVSVAT
jgi:hypothetical protein